MLLSENQSVALDRDDEPFGKGVGALDAHAVQPSRSLVCVAAEFAAAVQHGKADLKRGLFLVVFPPGGDARSVIHNLDATVFVQGDRDLGACPGKGLIHGVINCFVDQVVQRLNARTSDIHARAPADSLQSF